ncbi:membrane protein of unknown function [Streptantibioticus cattleyicolor NRRL 8057 = DSM 46488]|nr:membrane protein of unknown function [Streptantibioticus cattleyicolor NRRL 8057 = DSM 46488]
MLPSELQWVAALAGGEWPKADEDKLWELAKVHREFAKEIRAIAKDFQPAVDDVKAGVSGETAEAFEQYLAKLQDNLPQVASAAEQLADSCDQTALQIQYSKIMILMMLGWMAAEIAFLAWWCPESLPEIIAQGRAAIGMILWRLLAAVAVNVAAAGLMDAIAQLIQFGEGKRHSWDWKNTEMALGSGAINGAITGALFMAGGAVAPKLLETLLGKMALGGLGGMAGMAATDAAFGTDGNPGLGFVAGAVGGAIGHLGSLRSGKGGKDGANDDFAEVPKGPAKPPSLDLPDPGEGLPTPPRGDIGGEGGDGYAHVPTESDTTPTGPVGPRAGGDRMPFPWDDRFERDRTASSSVGAPVGDGRRAHDDVSSLGDESFDDNVTVSGIWPGDAPLIPRNAPAGRDGEVHAPRGLPGFETADVGGGRLDAGNLSGVSPTGGRPIETWLDTVEPGAPTPRPAERHLTRPVDAPVRDARAVPRTATREPGGVPGLAPREVSRTPGAEGTAGRPGGTARGDAVSASWHPRPATPAGPDSAPVAVRGPHEVSEAAAPVPARSASVPRHPQFTTSVAAPSQPGQATHAVPATRGQSPTSTPENAHVRAESPASLPDLPAVPRGGVPEGGTGPSSAVSVGAGNAVRPEELAALKGLDVPHHAIDEAPAAPRGEPGEPGGWVRQRVDTLDGAARRAGVPEADRRELSVRVTDAARTGRWHRAARDLEEFRDRIDVATLSRRYEAFGDHVAGGFERLGPSGASRTEWQREVDAVRGARRGGDPDVLDAALRGYSAYVERHASGGSRAHDEAAEDARLLERWHRLTPPGADGTTSAEEALRARLDALDTTTDERALRASAAQATEPHQAAQTLEELHTHRHDRRLRERLDRLGADDADRHTPDEAELRARLDALHEGTDQRTTALLRRVPDARTPLAAGRAFDAYEAHLRRQEDGRQARVHDLRERIDTLSARRTEHLLRGESDQAARSGERLAELERQLDDALSYDERTTALRQELVRPAVRPVDPVRLDRITDDTPAPPPGRSGTETAPPAVPAPHPPAEPPAPRSAPATDRPAEAPPRPAQPGSEELQLQAVRPAPRSADSADSASDPARHPVPTTRGLETPRPAPHPSDTPAAAPHPDQAPTARPAPEPAPRTKEWITTTLDQTRPTRLMPGARPPEEMPALSRRLPDGSRMPAYVDDLAKLLPDATEAERRQLLAAPGTFGHADVVLRGAEQVVGHIDEMLRRGPVRPADDSGVMGDVWRAVTRQPTGLTGEGRQLPFVDQDGRPRVLDITARHYPVWERFADDYGNPAKIDGMHRFATGAGQVKSVQGTRQFALGGPIGPVGTAAFSGFGRIAGRVGFTDKVTYGQTDQGVSQMETRSLDGSHVHLTHVHYDVRVTDPGGGEVPGSGFGFAMRNGLLVRLPDSLMTSVSPGRIPRSMELGPESRYRLVRTEGFGPVARIRDWAAGEIGVEPGSGAWRELDAFFSADGFQRMSRSLSNGRVTTVPLFADDKAKTPLGVFVVEGVVPRSAVLVTETSEAEVRDISTATVRNERSRAKGVSLTLEGSGGPAFNLLDLAGGVLDLRLQFGPTARYVLSATRSAGQGGSGGVKSAGQVKGDPTGLYLVRKTVHVRHGGSTGPAHAFQTWSVDRMTRSEARRLAGWDDTTRLALDNGAPEPFAPPYLTADRPPTLGMHRVEEFSFDDGRAVRESDGGVRTLLDHFADRVLAAVAEEYPGLVAPLDQLAPPERTSLGDRVRTALAFGGGSPRTDTPPPPGRWRNAEAYQTALANSLEILNVLSHQSMSGNLEALTTTGIRIRLNEPGRVGQGHHYVWLHGELTNRAYEGVQRDVKIRYSAPGTERRDGQRGRRRALEYGVEGSLAVRDPRKDAVPGIGAPDNAGTVQAGWRSGRQSDHESGYGPTVGNEPMSVSTTPSHLYRYDLSLTVSRGGYWRFRGLLRGVASLGLLGTQPFVFSRPDGVLIGEGPDGRAVGGGAVRGQVLISVPDQHAPAVDPHRAGHLNPYAALRDGVEPVPMSGERAVALAKGVLGPAGGAGRPGQRHAAEFLGLQQHPFVTVGVVVPPGLVRAADDVLHSASGGAWQLTEEGAPAREAVLRAFQPQYLTANFDQTSGALGWSAAGLMGKGPYTTLWATFRHFTTVRDLTALSGPVPMDTEMTLTGSSQASGRTGRATTVFLGGRLLFAKPQRTGPGVAGSYGVVVSPWSSSAGSGRSVTRTVVADMNLKGFGHQVLVNGTVDHWLAAASSHVGHRAVGKPYVPRALAGAAGATASVPGGWIGHVPEKSAHRLGLIDDGMGEVPTYTEPTWRPQPWLKDASFGTYPVNALDPGDVLAAFDSAVRRRLGPDQETLESVRALVSSRVLRALGGEMGGAGTSVPARAGGYGVGPVRIGDRTVRVRAELVPGEPVFEMLDHGTEMEESRRAVETEQDSSDYSSGADLGVTVGEGVATGNPTAVAEGPVYGETGTARRSRASAHTSTSTTVHRAASTEPHAEITTPYRLRITLEAADDPAPAGAGPLGKAAAGWRDFTGRLTISEEGDVGSLREHVPLSLMTPDAAHGTPPPDPRLAPPRLVPGQRLRTDRAAEVLDPGTRYGDGGVRPFTFPENGFHVRRIVGQENVRAASNAAIAASYGHGFRIGPHDSRQDVMRHATDTGLTRPGTGAAQTLEDATGNAALTAFWPHTLSGTGYSVPGLAHQHLAGTDTAALTLHSKPDFSRAVLLTVADGMKLEVLRESAEGATTSVSRDNAQDSSIGEGTTVRSEATGLTQYDATTTGPHTVDGDAVTAAGEHLQSVNVKPKTGRAFLFAVPTTWLGVADVHRGVKDSALGKLVLGTFGHARPGPRDVAAEAYTVAWVREDIARDLGLVDDTNFPAHVGKAWDAVGAAAKAWTDADKAYWGKRRGALRLREEADAAREAVEEARRAADTARRELVAELTDRQASGDGDWAQRTLRDLDTVMARSGTTTPAHDAYAEATRRLDAATARLDAARAAHDARRAELDTLRATADRAAGDYHRVRAATDQLTRWHRLNATEEGRRLLDGLPEPPHVTHDAPPKPPKPPKPAAPAYTTTGGPDPRLLAPDHTSYTLHDVPADGGSFHHALAAWLGRDHPTLLTDAGIDPADPATVAARLPDLLAATLTDPANADLLAFTAPDTGDTFTPAEADAAGLPLGQDTPARREFDGLGGLIPHTLKLDDHARAALAAAQLRRPGPGLDHSAADLLPALAARAFGARVTVVRADGTFQEFGALPDRTGQPHLVLGHHDRRYRLAVPDGIGAALLPAARDAGLVPPGPRQAATDALYRLLAARIRDDDLPAGTDLIDPDRAVPAETYERAGITLTGAQQLQAVLEGGLPPGEAGLTTADRLRLALHLTPDAPPVTAVAATVAARELGVTVEVSDPEGRIHRHGTGEGPVVRVAAPPRQPALR